MFGFPRHKHWHQNFCGWRSGFFIKGSVNSIVLFASLLWPLAVLGSSCARRLVGNPAPTNPGVPAGRIAATAPVIGHVMSDNSLSPPRLSIPLRNLCNSRFCCSGGLWPPCFLCFSTPLRRSQTAATGFCRDFHYQFPVMGGSYAMVVGCIWTRNRSCLGSAPAPGAVFRALAENPRAPEISGRSQLIVRKCSRPDRPSGIPTACSWFPTSVFGVNGLGQRPPSPVSSPPGEDFTWHVLLQFVRPSDHSSRVIREPDGNRFPLSPGRRPGWGRASHHYSPVFPMTSASRQGWRGSGQRDCHLSDSYTT